MLRKGGFSLLLAAPAALCAGDDNNTLTELGNRVAKSKHKHTD